MDLYGLSVVRVLVPFVTRTKETRWTRQEKSLNGTGWLPTARRLGTVGCHVGGLHPLSNGILEPLETGDMVQIWYRYGTDMVQIWYIFCI